MAARVSWLQVRSDVKANLSETEAPDSLTATALGPKARVSWVQVRPARHAVVSWIQVRPIAKARVSWIQSRPAGFIANLTATEAQDDLTGAATSVPPVYARVSWLQVRAGVLASLVATEAPDALTAWSVAVDRQVAGAWTPAIKSRWTVLDTSSVLAPITASLDVAEAPDALAATAVLVPRVAALTATESPDTLVAAAISKTRIAQLIAPEEPDQLESASVVTPISVDIPVGGPDGPSDFERALMERIKHREDQRVAMNNAVAISTVALLCEVLE